MSKRTFEGIVYEWTQNMSKSNPQRKIGDATIGDIKVLKAMLKRYGFFVFGGKNDK